MIFISIYQVFILCVLGAGVFLILPPVKQGPSTVTQSQAGSSGGAPFGGKIQEVSFEVAGLETRRGRQRLEALQLCRAFCLSLPEWWLLLLGQPFLCLQMSCHFRVPEVPLGSRWLWRV